jgi:hypothetical protein
MAIPERDFQSQCQCRRCKLEPTINVFGLGICHRHWPEIADEEKYPLLIDGLAAKVPAPALKEARANLQRQE